MSAASYSYPNSYDLYTGWTKLPNSNSAAQVGDVMFIPDTTGIAEWTPISEAITIAIPDDITVYVSPTGDDVTGTGTLLNPFETLPRCIEYISQVGYNDTAQIAVLDQLPLVVDTVIDLRPASKGNQRYPVVVTGATNITGSGTVVSCTANATTGLWTLVAGSIFTSADLGRRIVFTSGPLSTYQQSALLAPTELSCYISRVVSGTTVELAFGSIYGGGVTPPLAAVTFDVVENDASLLITTTTATTSAIITYGEICFNNISVEVDNTTAGNLFLSFAGERITLAGVNWSSTAGQVIVDVDGLMDSTNVIYDLTVSLIDNNTSGTFISGVFQLTLLNDDLNRSEFTSSAVVPGVAGLASIGGSWSFLCCRLYGWVSLASTGISSFTASELNANGTAAYVRSNSGILSISNANISNNNATAIIAAGGTTNVDTSVLDSNLIHFAVLGGATLNATTSGITLTPGLTCQQILVVDVGGYANLIGPVSTSTTVAATTNLLAPIVVKNGGRVFSSSNVTITASPSRGIYMEGYSTFQCSTLTVTSTADHSVYLSAGSNLNCTSSTLTCTNGRALRVEVDSSFSSNGTVTTSSLQGALSLTSGSKLVASNLNATSTDPAYATVYAGTNATCDINSAVTITSTGSYGLEATANSKISGTTLTIAGPTGITAPATGALVNINSTINFSTADITGATIALDVAGTQSNVTGTMELSTLSTTGTTALRLANGATVGAAPLNIDTAAVGVNISGSSLNFSGSTITNCVEPFIVSSGSVTARGAVTATATGGHCINLNNQSAWNSASTVTATSTGATFNAIRLRNKSSFNSAGGTLNSAGNTIDADSSSVASTAALGVTSTGGGGLNCTSTSVLCGAACTVSQQTNSSVTSGELRVRTNLQMTTNQAGQRTLVMTSAPSLAVGSTFTMSGSTNVVGLSVTGGSVDFGGACNGQVVELIGTDARFGGAVSLNSVTGTFTATNSLIRFGNTVSCTTSGGATAFSIIGGSVTSAGTITASSPGGVGVALANTTVNGGGITSTGNAIGLSSTGSTIACSTINCASCATGVSTTTTNINCAQLIANDSSSTSVDITASDIFVSGSIAATSAAGVGAVQLNIGGGSTVRSTTTDLTRTLAGTTGFSSCNVNSSSFTTGVFTATNSGGSSLFAIACPSIAIATFNSTNANGGNPHISLNTTTFRSAGLNISGGGSQGVAVGQGSIAHIAGTITGTGGTGVRVNCSTLSTTGLVVSNCGNNGVEILGSSRANISSLTGTGNTAYGLSCLRGGGVTVSTSTITGGSGDVQVGLLGTKTWANIATGEQQHTCDFGGGGALPTQVIMCSYVTPA